MVQRTPPPPNPRVVLNILWLASMAQSLVFLFLPYNRVPLRAEAAGGVSVDRNELLVHATISGLVGSAFSATFVSTLIPRMLLSRIVSNLTPEQQARGILDAALVRQMAPPIIIRYALTESLVLLGFLAGMTTQRIDVYFSFFFVAVALFLLRRPTDAYLRCCLGAE